MTALDKINKERIKPEDFVALIEISKGSKMTYELDKETGYIILDRVLYTATRYPANYGLIPRTLAADGDHLDVLVLCSEAIETNCLVRCYPIGMIAMIDQNFLDEKIIAVPFGDPTFNVYKSIHDLPFHISEEMMHFFSVYKTLEGKKTAVNKICDAAEAMQKIDDYLDFYEKTHRNDPDLA